MNPIDKTFFYKRKVLLTGGGGFIGAHVVKKLVELEAQVSIIFRGLKVPWRVNEWENQIQLYQGDVREKEKINHIVKDFKPDVIVHLAAYGVNASDQDITTALTTNIYGVVNVMEAAIESGCKRVINIGSCAEYGNHQERIIEETPLQPVNLYGSSKAAATILVHQMGRNNSIDVITLRLFGVYGEMEEPHKVFSQTILTLLKDEDMILSTCEQKRDYCYVGDIVEAILLAAQSQGIKNEIFNVLRGEEYPLKFYIEKIYKSLESNKKLLFGGLPHRDYELWAPTGDNTKIKSILNWEAKTNLMEGIKRTVDWYKKNREIFYI